MSAFKLLASFLPKLPFRPFASEATFKTQPYVLYRLEGPPAPAVTLNRADALRFFEEMVTIHQMEATLNHLYKSKTVRGFCHLYSGQEAVAVGTFAALRPQDTTITTYRCHGWGFLYYQSVDPIIAELVGVRSGCVRGKGGSMHIYGKHKDFYGGSAIVGSHVPVGVGIALAHKYRNTDAVSLICYGDGATNNGNVLEAYNMAKLWELPCFFLCENNIYGMGTKLERTTKNTNVFTKGDFIPGIRVDGMDVLSVREAARFAIEHIRAGKGPIIVEAQSYRYFGHSLSDPGTTYRTYDEIKEVRTTRDPITTFNKKILEAGLATEEELAAIEKKVKASVRESATKAEADHPVDVEELTHDIYANEVISEVRGINKVWKHKSSGRAWNLK
ncbi:hypothetical protein Zmor_004672 [Zophobas morio]|uniref:pyruvate dehydrogenase (acetyl-transferring) n=1 Tax=Zophobas morio TaxID=2755281 RepID=A0AA38IUP5_9CUCU|nr:hypothetical protein Zmor_004672 [Zophobas morio]